MKCFATIERTLKSAVSLTTEFVEASLRVKTSEMRVNYLLQQYHSMKDSFEKAEVHVRNHLTFDGTVEPRLSDEITLHNEIYKDNH